MTISEALLNADGTSAIAWAEASRTDLSRTISNAEDVAGARNGRVETRDTGKRTRRVYVLKGVVTGAELDRVRQAIEESRHGAEAVRWRHWSEDPPADADECPLFRIAESGFGLARTKAGVMAEVSLTLEEV